MAFYQGGKMLDFQFSREISLPSEYDGDPNSISFHPGKIVRIFGNGSKDVCARFLNHHYHSPAAWIDSEIHPLPMELRNMNLNWEKILFIHGEEDREWACKYLLSTKLFPILIFQSNRFSKKFFSSIREKLIQSNSMLILISNSSSIGKWIDEDFFAYEKTHIISLFPKEVG
jgi:hypothetical protein